MASVRARQFLAVVTAAGLLFAACSSAGSESGNGDNSATTDARTATIIPTVPSTTLRVVAVDTTFDQSTITAVAGSISIEIDNRDAGVPHNFAVYPSREDPSDPLGTTAIESGPVKQELTLSLEAGDYYFQCDVHPATMNGTLTVE
jgi:plastocyanin